MKGLGDVIIGAGVETLYLVAPAVARGQHENGHGSAGPPPCFQHRDAIHLWQPDVQDDGIVWLALAEIMPLFAVKRPIDDVAGIGKRSRELSVEVGIILDDEETQGEVPPLSPPAGGTMTGRIALCPQVCHYIVPLHNDRRKPEKGCDRIA